jgi:hypothetical protein
MSVPDVFRRITKALDQAGIGYMLSGSFASAYYGVPRSTQDIDLVIAASAEQLRSFIDALPEAELLCRFEFCPGSSKAAVDVQCD